MKAKIVLVLERLDTFAFYNTFQIFIERKSAAGCMKILKEGINCKQLQKVEKVWPSNKLKVAITFGIYWNWRHGNTPI